MTLTLRMPLRCVHVEQALAFGGGSSSPQFRCVKRHQSGTGEPENLRVREKPQGETADAPASRVGRFDHGISNRSEARRRRVASGA